MAPACTLGIPDRSLKCLKTALCNYGVDIVWHINTVHRAQAPGELAVGDRARAKGGKPSRFKHAPNLAHHGKVRVLIDRISVAPKPHVAEHAGARYRIVGCVPDRHRTRIALDPVHARRRLANVEIIHFPAGVLQIERLEDWGTHNEA